MITPITQQFIIHTPAYIEGYKMGFESAQHQSMTIIRKALKEIQQLKALHIVTGTVSVKDNPTS